MLPEVCCKLADCLELQLWQCCTCPPLKCPVTAVRAAKLELNMLEAQFFCLQECFFLLLVLGPACAHRSHHLPADRPLSGGLTVCLHVVGRVVMLLLQGLACSMHCKLGCFAWRLALDFAAISASSCGSI